LCCANQADELSHRMERRVRAVVQLDAALELCVVRVERTEREHGGEIGEHGSEHEPRLGAEPGCDGCVPEEVHGSEHASARRGRKAPTPGSRPIVWSTLGPRPWTRSASIAGSALHASSNRALRPRMPAPPDTFA